MKADLAASKCDNNSKPTGVNSLTATGATKLSSQASYAPSLASTTPDAPEGHCVFPESRWQSNVSADRNLVHEHDRPGPDNSHGSLDGAEYALLGSGSGLTSCSINCAEDIPLLPRPVNMPILSDATGGSVECIALRQVGYRLENVNHLL